MDKANLDLSLEPLPASDGQLLQVGTVAPTFSFLTTSAQTLSIDHLYKRGLVLLNFVKGIWCPFCQNHMLNLRNWQNRNIETNLTLLVVSSDSIEAIRDWKRENSISYLFGSAIHPDQTFKDYGVRVQDGKYARPATYLIEKGGKIRMAYDGTRGSSWTQSCEKCGI